MYLVVLLCFLTQIQGFTFRDLIHNPYWPDGTDVILDQMSMEMYGYDVWHLQRVKPNVSSTERTTKESRAMWEKVDKMIMFSPSYNASLRVIGTLSALKDILIPRNAAKSSFADTWDGLIHQEQAQWKKDFPYAAYAEKFSNIRRRNSKFCFGLCSELREGSFCWYQLTQGHVSDQAPAKRS
ncbi:hypothetical protein GCK32_012379 [Trichostrongylus colubriformis]|uniref:Uncharacterized protein n=1 Tax=Trichostrongylus colubriformis TaxID=6319 RepID=A0AAN8J273_TRICO